MYKSLTPQIISVEPEPKGQAPAPSSGSFWLRLLHQPSTLAPVPPQQLPLLQRKVANLTSGLFKCWSLLRNNNMSTNVNIIKRSLQDSRYDSRHFSACDQGSHCVFLPRSAFFSRPGCLGLSMKNRVKSGFCEVINSSATSCDKSYKHNFILQCLHVHIRWESTHIGWRGTCSIGFISSYKIIAGVIYMLLALMPIEETVERRVRTDCLNFDVSLRIQIKKNKFQLQEESTGIIFL